MRNFFKYLLSVNENWLMIDEEDNICTAELREHLPYLSTEWKGIFNTEKLQKNVIYRISNLVKEPKLEEIKKGKIEVTVSMDVTKNIKAENIETADDDIIDGINIFRADWENDDDEENPFVLKNPVIIGIKQTEEVE